VERLGEIAVRDVPDPERIPGSLLVRVEACAVCGSDIRIFRKGDPRASLPRIIGHEIAGVVERLDGETREPGGGKPLAVGDRVTIAPGHGCGRCVYCRTGRGNVCVDPRPSVGYASSGGFAQYIVPPRNVVENGFVNRIPDGLSFEDASMAELLAGCMHVELARARGASKVMLTQRSTARLALAAERFSPDVVIPAEGDELVRRVQEETDGLGADVVIVAAPSAQAQETALRLAAPRGRISFFGGLPRDNHTITIDANRIHYLEISLTGASSSLGRQNREALELIASHRIHASRYITHRFGLEQTPAAFAAVEGKQAIKAVVFPWR